MKSHLAFPAIAAALLLGACSSAGTSNRSEYTDPAFTSRASKRAAREAEIRKSFPTLSEKQIEQKLATEFPPGATR